MFIYNNNNNNNNSSSSNSSNSSNSSSQGQLNFLVGDLNINMLSLQCIYENLHSNIGVYIYFLR